jgi:3-vinyl bacteriochlorophyllide hydratase
MMVTPRFFDQFIESMDCCPWGTLAGRIPERIVFSRDIPRVKSLYTPEQRRKRDETRWTLVQGVLAPVQFLAFFVSLCLVVRYLMTGDGLTAATTSVVIKTGLLYAIMITGSIWENRVFGRYLFAPAFFWEDVFSIVVLVMHSAYIAALFTGYLDAEHLMLLALAAYASYVVNATQFLLKLRAARLDHEKSLKTSALPGIAN